MAAGDAVEHAADNNRDTLGDVSTSRATQRGLAFATDVEQTGLERQCHGKPREHIVGRM